MARSLPRSIAWNQKGCSGTSDPKDRRSRIVELTETGRRLIERAFQKHAADMEETMAVLRSGERVELVRLLKKVGMWAAARLDDNGRVRPPRGRQGAW